MGLRIVGGLLINGEGVQVQQNMRGEPSGLIRLTVRGSERVGLRAVLRAWGWPHGGQVVLMV